MNTPTLPPRRNGDHHDTVSMRCLDGDAAGAFGRAVEHFYAVNRWGELNDSLRTTFQLFDGAGQPVARQPETGDLIRIDVAGPGTPSAGGYDWVRVSAIERGEAPCHFHAITIRPCAPPQDPGGAVAHFYTAESSNTFVVRMLGNCLLAEVHGRNELPNTGGVPLLDRARNELLSLAGRVGLGRIQWQDWADGLLSVV